MISLVIISKYNILKILRDLGFAYLVDRIRFYFQAIKYRKVNRNFVKENPDVRLPPDCLMYESFRLHYRNYFFDGYDTALWITDYLKEYRRLDGIRILDWGCGPGRIIRHLPRLTGSGCEFTGTDTNPEAIEWCRNNIPDCSFILHSLEPPLTFKNAYFDIILGISVFTHLSGEMHFKWFHELLRILKPEGIIFITSHGDNFRIKMTGDELAEYNAGQLVIRGNVEEGRRVFSAFQPVQYMIKLFGNVEILRHISDNYGTKNKPSQDVWIIRKK